VQSSLRLTVRVSSKLALDSARSLKKFVILQTSTLWQGAPEGCHFFAVLHQLDFRQTQFLALCYIVVGFIRKIRLPIRPTNKFISHSGSPKRASTIRSPNPSLDAILIASVGGKVLPPERGLVSYYPLSGQSLRTDLASSPAVQG
jgi:hypothetical protein